MIEITLSSDEPVLFREASLRDYRGTRLPGSLLHRCQRKDFSLFIQDFANDLWSISCRQFDFSKETIIRTREQLKWLRMEIVLTGGLPIQTVKGKPFLLRAGQYHITGSDYYQSHFTALSACNYIVIYFSPDLIAQTGVAAIAEKFISFQPKALPGSMNDLVFEMLNNPYRIDLQSFFFDSCIRDLILLHLAIGGVDLPTGVSEKEYTAVIAADNIIAADLAKHYSIRSLARKVGINEYTLKKGFSKIFGVGPFERLMQRRMKEAKRLLETTDKLLKEVAELAGYSSFAAFSTGFKKRFKMPPSEWREKSRRS